MTCSRIILDTKELDRIVSRLANQISPSFASKKNRLALVIMEGAKSFAHDLFDKLDFSLDAEYINASSYTGKVSTGCVTIENNQRIRNKIRGKNILLIDDIYDTGMTLYKLLEWIRECEPASVQTCVLLGKEIPHTKKINIDFLGTTVEDAFLVGYGLDYDDQYRDLPYIGVLDEELICDERTSPPGEIANQGS